MTSNPNRQEALLALIELRTTVDAALARLYEFERRADDELVMLTVRDLRRALDGFSAGTLDEAGLIAWAEAVHGREDIGLDAADRDLLSAALFELSTPELFGSITVVVSEIKGRLG